MVYGPGHDSKAEHVEDDRGVDLSFPGGMLGDISVTLSWLGPRRAKLRSTRSAGVSRGLIRRRLAGLGSRSGLTRQNAKHPPEPYRVSRRPFYLTPATWAGVCS